MSANKFFKVYESKLREAVERKPGEYAYGVDLVPVVVQKVRAAWDRRTANKDGAACKATCKELGIKHTYTAIYEYLRQAEGNA